MSATLKKAHDRPLEGFKKLKNNHDTVIGMKDKYASCAKKFYAKIGAKKELNKDRNDTIMTTPLSLRLLRPTIRLGMTSNLSQRQTMLANS
jgi:hypothetical protein